jgi:hypothetical protein
MAVPEEIQEKVLEEATSATPNFTVDTNDERFQQVDTDVENSWNEYSQTVGGAMNDVDKYYKDISDTAAEWADKQAQIQQDNTDFIIEKTEQEIDKAQKDYIKEQSGAYVDWQKQSNKYGVNAEKMASAGLAGTGFSESSQVAMYNQYQNRVATARETINQVVMNYNNNIKEAMLQNNAALAQIYADLAMKQSELALEGFMYKQELVNKLADKKLELDNVKWSRYQDIYNQINTENSLAWDATKYYGNQKWQTTENEKDRNLQREMQRIDQEFEEKMAAINHKYDIALENARTENEKILIKEKKEAEIAIAKEKLANDKALLKYENDLNNSSKVGTTINKGVKSLAKAGAGFVSSNSNGTKITGNSKVTKKTKSSSSSSSLKTSLYPVDTSSVLALGYGPISAAYLNQLVSQGKVIEYVEDGKRKFARR